MTADFASRLTDPGMLLALLVAIAVFATFYTIAHPFFERGDLNERMKAVAVERDHAVSQAADDVTEEGVVERRRRPASAHCRRGADRSLSAGGRTRGLGRIWHVGVHKAPVLAELTGAKLPIGDAREAA